MGTDDIYNTEVHADNKLAFACDEPCKPELVQCTVKGFPFTSF